MTDFPLANVLAVSSAIAIDYSLPSNEAMSEGIRKDSVKGMSMKSTVNHFEKEYGRPVNPDDPQEVEWAAFFNEQVSKGKCPGSGLTIKECKSWLCDCFDFEEEYGVSQK